MQGKAGHYNGEMVAGALLEKESKILAQLMLEDPDEATLKKRLFSENLLQKRSQQTIKRQVSLIKSRLTTLYPDAWKLIAKGSSEAANQALLVGAIKSSRLLGDFLQKVIKGHISLFQKQVSIRDWDKFLEECAQIDSHVNHWSDSTKEKLRQVVFRILTQVKILENARNRKILPFFLNPEVKRLLVKHNETYVLKCLEIS